MNSFIPKISRLSRHAKRMIMLAADLVLLPCALWAAFSLRLGELYEPPGDILWLFAAALVVAIPVFTRFGLYRAVVHYMGAQAYLAIVQSVSLSVLIWGAVVLLSGVHGIPRSVTIIYWLTSVAAVGGSRFAVRWLLSLPGYGECKKNVLIYGAGSAGIQLAVALQHGRELCPVAFLDDKADLVSQNISGLVVHPVSDLDKLIRTKNVRDVLLAIPSASRARRREIIAGLESHPVNILTIPGVSDLAQGKVQVEDIRPVDILDLLGRDFVPPDEALLARCIRGKSVMVTGAGGSIGSELCRQIIRRNPSCLVLFEKNEYALYRIHQELKDLDSHAEIIPLLGSVHHRHRVERACSACGVQTIYHAAAYKHVPMVEANPIEAIHNNIFGTLHTAQAALDAGVETFVLISTDKAVRPTNVMGATKRVAELVLQGLHEKQQAAANNQCVTRFCMVRFGNVLGSSGSVVPLFRKQISSGGPVTVTHPEIIRYFMTIPEAAGLVIQAGAMGEGGDVFVLDMGEPVHILDLARRMIRLSGLIPLDEEHPDGDIAIEFTGLRPGEKLYEELLIGDHVTGTEHPLILRAQEQFLPWPRLEILLQKFEQAARRFDCAETRQLLSEAVKSYQPQCGIQDPVWLRMEQTLVESNVQPLVSIHE